MDDLVELGERIGIEFNDFSLLSRALTHRSYLNENPGSASEDNERLEFLGDAILGQAVTVKLYTDYPEISEGDLAKRRAALVSSVALAEVARRIGLGQYVLLGRGEEQTGGRNKESILADTTEAVIGATYLSAGPAAATDLVLRLVEPLRADPERYGAAMDPKTSLQELAARLAAPAPVYSVVSVGPDHNREFTGTVIVGKIATETGVGTSKKHAEMAAALAAWRTLSARA